MTEQRTMTLLEAAEWFRYHPVSIFVRAALLEEHRAGCSVCGATAYAVAGLCHTLDCPYDAAVRAIAQAKGGTS